MLFHLGRRLAVEGHRILIVSVYRPEEVTADRDAAETLPPSAVATQDVRHPLEKVLNGFKRHFGDVWVDLTQVDQAEGRRFVDVYLDSEPNCLGEAFRGALFRHTQGHPLFTIELLRTRQERGELIRDADAFEEWTAGPTLNWGTLPARVQAVIQERLDRLERTSREMLTIASVEGERNTAQVIAQVQDIPEREVLQALTHNLGMRHRLVRELGEIQVDHRFVSRYRFSHRLFQRYLYESLSPGERRLLHWEITAALEKLCLTCYRVLRAGEDPRAQEVLITAYSLLQELASKIEDEGLQRSFFENVAAHRELLAAWTEMGEANSRSASALNEHHSSIESL